MIMRYHLQDIPEEEEEEEDDDYDEFVDGALMSFFHLSVY